MTSVSYNYDFCILELWLLYTVVMTSIFKITLIDKKKILSFTRSFLVIMRKYFPFPKRLSVTRQETGTDNESQSFLLSRKTLNSRPPGVASQVIHPIMNGVSNTVSGVFTLICRFLLVSSLQRDITAVLSSIWTVCPGVSLVRQQCPRCVLGVFMTPEYPKSVLDVSSKCR